VSDIGGSSVVSWRRLKLLVLDRDELGVFFGNVCIIFVN
jgi:hypothetical protein